MKFSESFLTELTDRNDIADVVGSYVSLSKRSGANLFGLCPFHSEKTPSFSVSPDKQIYHCFGCGKGGGVVNFIMEIENVSFPEAVELLAKRAGMQMPQEEDDSASRRRKRLYALNRDAALFFREALKGADGNAARQYIAGCRIGAATATAFGLGYAPDTWDSLMNAMRAKGYSSAELIQADLIRQSKNGSWHDAFRNRVMFPVIDVRGNVIGFSGRILGDGEPKYLNSRETPVFVKGSNLFGLNIAKKSKSGYIILVEGNVDVVTLHQAGFDSAVASLGTSLTGEQARLISRYTDQIILAYDSDGAGQKAAQRAISIFEKLDIKVKVLRWEGAKDPDDYIKLKGAGAFRNLIENSEAQTDYRLQNILSKYDLTQPQQQVEYLKEATKLVASFPGSVERQVYAIRVAEMAGVSRDAVIKEVEQLRKRMISSARRTTEHQAVKAVDVTRPTAGGPRYASPDSAAAEEGIVRLLYLEPALEKQASEAITPEEFTSPELRHLYEVISFFIRDGRAMNTTVLSEDLPGDEVSLLVSLLSKPEDLSRAADTMKDYISMVKACAGRAAPVTDLRALAMQKQNDGKGYKQ